MHIPTGEYWVVAFAENNDLSWCGYPEGLAQLKDCQLIERCSDTEHREWVERFRDNKTMSYRRSRVLALYGS